MMMVRKLSLMRRIGLSIRKMHSWMTKMSHLDNIVTTVVSFMDIFLKKNYLDADLCLASTEREFFSAKKRLLHERSCKVGPIERFTCRVKNLIDIFADFSLNKG